MYVAYADPVAAIRSEAHRRAKPGGWPVRLCRLLVRAWVRHIERRTEAAVRRLDRAGLLEVSRRTGATGSHTDSHWAIIRADSFGGNIPGLDLRHPIKAAAPSERGRLSHRL